MEIFDSGSSQNSDLGQEQLNNMEESAKADNTKRATKWGLNRFEEWQTQRAISFDWKTVSSKELNDILRKFYAEVKTKQGRTLSPSALTGIRAAVHRFITSPPNNRAINILKDSDFIPANNMFQAKCKLYYRSGNPKPTHKNAIEDGDMKKLSQYFIQQNDGNTSAYESAATTFWTPERLQQYVWFNLCYHFGRRGREGWRQLSKTSYEIILDDVGKRYVRIHQAERTKNYLKEVAIKVIRITMMSECIKPM